MDDPGTPTLSDFLETCREALAYLKDFGFSEVSPPPHRYANPYAIWFKADDRFVIVAGEGWGEFASITLEHSKGLELPEIYLVPKDKRPKPGKNRKDAPAQLQQVRDAAKRLCEYGADFLRGDLERFFEYAKPLPPYKQPAKDG